jgi:hypothetical protein
MSPNTVFVTFACAKDVHYAKALLGSIRHFYPAISIHVVLDDDVPTVDAAQVSRFPNSQVHHVRELNSEHKLQLTGLLAKLNVFFLPGVSSALVADADSILTGPVLEGVDLNCDLNSLNAKRLDLSYSSDRAMFDRWAIDLRMLESKNGMRVPTPCKFVQGSHFYVNVERFPKDLLYRMLPDMAHSHTATHLLRAGDQGFWNYIANFDERLGLRAVQTPVTLQVGVSPHCAEYDALDYLARRSPKEMYFIHYVGVCRKFLRRNHEYAAALGWGTRLYYEAVGRNSFLGDEFRRAIRSVTRAASGPIRRMLNKAAS